MGGVDFPSLIQTRLAFGHDPGGVAFVEERLAPLDELIVDIADDMRTKGLVAPVREREPPPQGGFVALHDGAYSCPKVGIRQYGLKSGRDLFNKRMGWIRQLTVEGFDEGQSQSLGQTGAQHFTVCDGAGADRQ